MALGARRLRVVPPASPYHSLVIACRVKSLRSRRSGDDAGLFVATQRRYPPRPASPRTPAPHNAAPARKALSCGALAELDQATQPPLTVGRFMSNFLHSLTLTTFRISADPVTAEKELRG